MLSKRCLPAPATFWLAVAVCLGALGAGLLLQHRSSSVAPVNLVHGQPSEAIARDSAGSREVPAQEETTGELHVVHGEAAAFVPTTWEALEETTAGPAVVRVLRQVRVEDTGGTRHRVSESEAAAINASRPAGSARPDVREGDWAGTLGMVTTVFAADVRWLDARRGDEQLELRFPGGAYADSFLVVDGMPLPAIGTDYVMFITLGDGWATPAYVQFRLQDGRLAQHMHNESGVGKDLLGLSPSELAERARNVRFQTPGAH